MDFKTRQLDQDPEVAGNVPYKQQVGICKKKSSRARGNIHIRNRTSRVSEAVEGWKIQKMKC